MAEIRALRPANAKADDALVAALRELLADAEAGRLCALVGVADYHDGMIDYVTAGIADWWAMSARLVDMSRDIVLDDEDDE